VTKQTLRGATVNIYIDHSEARRGSRLSQTVIKASTVLVGLEALTGADLILSPLDEPKIEQLTKAPITEILLRVHTQMGILVQRKSGGDFISSIGKLKEIEYRMGLWGLPWLLITGRLGCNSKGKVVMDKRTYGLSYWSVIGALDAWILRGGGVTILTNDDQVAKWISDMCKRLDDCSEPALVLPQKPRQGLMRDSELAQVVGTLMTFKGIGGTTALAIARQCGNLREAFRLLSDPQILRRKDKPEGVGPVLVKEFRRTLNLSEGESL
jgi:ERCC4-type nuclease